MAQQTNTSSESTPIYGVNLPQSLSQNTIVENIAIDKHDVASAWLPTKYGKFRMHVFRNLEGEEADSVVLIYGEIKPEDVPLVRLHSECMTGDVFGSRKCDCGEQLNAALSMIVKENAGVLIYSRQEGRGIGLFNKIRAYELQDQGRDTIQANEELGLPVDGRTYMPAAAMLRYLKIPKIRLITNNPAKAESLRALGIDVVSTVANVIPPHPENKDYLKIKELKMRHKFTSLVIPPAPASKDESKTADSTTSSSSSSSSESPSSPRSSEPEDDSPIISCGGGSPTLMATSSSSSSSSGTRSCKKRYSSELECRSEPTKIQAI